MNKKSKSPRKKVLFRIPITIEDTPIQRALFAKVAKNDVIAIEALKEYCEVIGPFLAKILIEKVQKKSWKV